MVAMNVAAAFRTGQREKACTHGLGGAQQQFANETQGNVQPKSDLLRKLLIAFRVADKGCKAARGKTGAGISREYAEDVAVAALQQDVGHGFADLRASGDRQQMRLGLGVGDVDEIVVAEPRRRCQNWLCNDDVVVAGEPAHDVDGCIVDRRQAPAEFGQCFSFDSLDQMSEDIVKNIDLPVTQPIRIRNEQVRDTPQRIDALVFGAALDGVFQLGNE
jgi:hypothetical protein